MRKRKSHVLFKLCAGRRGSGIRVLAPETAGSETVAEVQAGKIITQEFVLPWLADDDGKLLPRQSSAKCRGYKFDFRIYVAVTSTGLLYLSDIGRVKFCSEPFDLARISSDDWQFSLLVNGAINKHNPKPTKKGGVTLTLEEFKTRNAAVYGLRFKRVCASNTSPMDAP